METFAYIDLHNEITSLVSRPSHVFQRTGEKNGNPWSIWWCTDYIPAMIWTAWLHKLTCQLLSIVLTTHYYDKFVMITADCRGKQASDSKLFKPQQKWLKKMHIPQMFSAKVQRVTKTNSLRFEMLLQTMTHHFIKFDVDNHSTQYSKHGCTCCSYN